MNAEIISSGTELLLGKTLNTSAFYLTGQLSGIGVEVHYHTTVGDNKERLLGAVQQALSRSELVFLTGGLGPTADDLTKEVISLVLDLKMNFDQKSMVFIEQFYKDNNDLPPGSEKQAFFPEGSLILPNDWGTAPGAIVKKEGKYCVILPGPPAEMKPMFENYALPEIQKIISGYNRMHVRTLKVFGLGESELELKLSDLMKETTPFLTLLDKHTYMDVRVSVRGQDEKTAAEILDRTEKAIRQRLQNQIFGINEETHSQIVGRLLREKKQTLATAESCSGGLLGGRITSEAGSSDYYLGGVVSYANSAKEGLIGVKNSSLLKYGAVSEEVAREMAEGVRKALGADYGLSTTGIAGPGGGSGDKPVGLVYLALAGPNGTLVEKKLFSGNRESIRNMTVETGLNMLRLDLQNMK
ncbi:MAG: competence/damage-inducible protein A [Peptococcaceae bacterium]|nr:competence/damage-inducible protein A [Peptococcaceae bacterium]